MLRAGKWNKCTVYQRLNRRLELAGTAVDGNALMIMKRHRRSGTWPECFATGQGDRTVTSASWKRHYRVIETFDGIHLVGDQARLMPWENSLQALLLLGKKGHPSRSMRGGEGNQINFMMANKCGH